MSDQQLRDLQAIIGRQEEELDGLRRQVTTLEIERDAYHEKLACTVVELERYAKFPDRLRHEVIDLLEGWAE